ncbi:aminoglycoside phosphotransferase family protein [Streptomyces angustmyceticus]|uniref:Kinase n=1 Tax=Streptomyces angustmyceticus TaxID=285578 RepID=A0A5J4LK57_9ACTN|nr:aminoglycoside phosphotransferase family protein [Streptomyces angustmyceticus]UAL66834.1 aminoglycoside phosphotransferase family protein [Streptomyces angustmyceticus]GES31939.1 kinase [Streptomyces angustmyceticus]
MATAPIEPPQRLVSSLSGDPEGPVREWLDTLPTLVQRQLDAWDLTLERVQAPGGRSSLLCLVRQKDRTAAALKFPVPGQVPAREGTALEAWDGWGAVRLLRSDDTSGALLLERLRGGVSLRSLPEAKALLEAAGTVRRLWVPAEPEHPFETLAGRTEEAVQALRTAGALTPAAGPLVDRALELRRALPDGSDERFLLHGAFRQGKVLAGERAPWLAVGPEPVVGERAYDLAALVLDRFEDLVAGPGAAAAARRRVAKLADSLEVDRDRLRDWTLYRAVDLGVREATAGDRQRGELLLEFAAWL